MRCKITDRDKPLKHFLERYYMYSINNYVTLDELYNYIETNFNSGRRSYDRKGIKGERYKVELVSYKWKNMLIIAIVEKVKECSLKPITIFPKY